jgi:hypothetical protein
MRADSRTVDSRTVDSRTVDRRYIVLFFMQRTPFFVLVSRQRNIIAEKRGRDN